MRRFASRDLALALFGLLAIASWELAGWDLAVTRAFGGAHGFLLRDAWLTRTVAHDGGRLLAAIVLVLMLVDLIRPFAGGRSRAARAYWLSATVGVMLLVPAIKRTSGTSCPWDLAEFGGSAAYVPHWLIGVADGGPGHCFPSGHAVSAFAFFGLYFLWRHERPRYATIVAMAVTVLGVVYGLAQTARGAHFASHPMWSAWIAWTLCAVAAAIESPGAIRPFAAAALARRAN